MRSFYLLPSVVRSAIITPTFPIAAVSCASTTSSATRGYRLFATSHSPTSLGQLRKPQAISYEYALRLLNTLQSNRAIRSSVAQSPGDKNHNAIPEMLEWLRRAGYKPEDLAKAGLRFIHVAGSSGKGSVCVMVENMLLQYQQRNTKVGIPVGKIGLYTSPHLVTVRERVRINGSPISQDDFTRYFWELWTRFEHASATTKEGNALIGLTGNNAEARPGYFRFLTLLALHIFMQQGVRVAVIECGIGGEHDSTNILPPEAVAVSAITKLEIDHIGMLGETIEDIAWHKAGIIKPRVPSFTTSQQPVASAVLRSRAAEKGSDITFVPRLPAIHANNIELGLLGDFQKDNASLAVAITTSYLHQMGVTEGIPRLQEIANRDLKLPNEYIRGLENVCWPGRCQIVKEGNIQWYIDGAHTHEGMQAVATWFRSKMDEAFLQSNPPTAVMLIFNQDDRDGRPLLRSLLTDLKEKQGPVTYTRTFDHAAFCPNIPFASSQSESVRDLSAQRELMEMYQSSGSTSSCQLYGSVQDAVRFARRISDGEHQRVLVLVTGSLYLAGALLQNLSEQSTAKRVCGTSINRH
ncbi:uncharacterized protein BP5553_10655 [Venustampulla echinocandica]|uniref:Folylpolyglutamate synthase n=1 Tax=Venustampulla echinocandica TaxID=2656787 RepID=A0A370T8P6_9HELO|nr:uncharacterized protein BP5553_10655 [Venustampulla echinocandica]RDL29790.1 hypothetical protein BP5553_10655 [Venustampulla echinocandica]